MREASATLERVRSRDGTEIVSWRSGTGPPLVLVHGATSAHWSWSLLTPHLEEEFTLYAVDRRGRGESGDPAGEYEIAQEFADIAAVVDSLEEPATLLGHSYGATVALGAAPLAKNLRKLVLYEPAPGFSSVEQADIEQVEELLAGGKREEALVAAFGAFGFTQEELDQIRSASSWPARVDAAHTLPREIRAEEAYRVEPDRLRSLVAPALLLLGEESPSWAKEGADIVAAAIPDARIALLPGQGHMAHVTAPELVAQEVRRFLRA